MNQLDFYLDNQHVPPPDNWQDFEVEVSFENNAPQSVLNSTKLVWTDQNAAYLNARYNSGTTGGLGIFEAPSLSVTACPEQDSIFNGISDITDIDTRWNCDMVTTKIKDFRIDRIEELMDSVSFAALANPTAFPGNPGPYGGYADTGNGNRWFSTGSWINAKPESQGGDYLEVLYQNNNIPDFIEFFTMVLAIYNMVNEAIKIANDISGTVSAIGAAAGALSIGAALAAVVELIAQVAGLILTCFALVNLFEMAIDYLISPVFTKLGMNPTTMLQRACAYFGIQFQSSIMQNAPYNNLCIMPAKRAWDINQTLTRSVSMGFLSTYNSNQRMMYDEVYNFNNGGYAYGYYDGTVGQLLRDMETQFNAQARVIVNSSGQPILYLERDDYFYNLSTLTLPPVSDQAPYGNSFGTNASEVAANIMVQYQQDGSDLNTYTYYQGSSCYYQVTPKVVQNQNNVTLMNLETHTLPFAHAQRKDRLTATESVFNQVWNDLIAIPNVVISVINGIISAINWVIRLFGGKGIPTIPKIPSNPFNGSVGIMYLWQHITSVPKIFILGAKTTISNVLRSYKLPSNNTGYTIDPNNKGLSNPSLPNLSARSITRFFYYSRQVVGVYPPAYAWSGSYAASRAGQPYYNQWQYYENEIPFCCAGYNTLINNNVVYSNTNIPGRCMSNAWVPFRGYAKMKYKLNIPYSYNLKASFVVDGVTNLTSI